MQTGLRIQNRTPIILFLEIVSNVFFRGLAEQNFLFDRILNDGDVILLASGGHGFEALSDVDIVEVKQGPYAGDLDKTRFKPSAKKTRINSLEM